MLKNPAIIGSAEVRTYNFRLFGTYIYFFALTLVVQTGHMVEHIVQMTQKFLLHVPAHGLIGQWDIGQVHFGFNTVYFAFLFPLLLGWFNYRQEIKLTSRRWGWLTGLFLATVLVQTYHQAEHSVKLVQFLETHMQGTAGILGAHFDLVIVHFVLNTLVYVPLVIVLLGAGLHRSLGIRLYGRR